jgi:hypothetical protein
VLEACFRVSELDIRDNLIQASLVDLVNAIRKNCPNLQKLFIERALKGKETATPKQYV